MRPYREVSQAGTGSAAFGLAGTPRGARSPAGARYVQELTDLDGVPVGDVVEVGQVRRVDVELCRDLRDAVARLDDVCVAARGRLGGHRDDQHLAGLDDVVGTGDVVRGRDEGPRHADLVTDQAERLARLNRVRVAGNERRAGRG